MALQSGSLQTTETDFGTTGHLDGTVTGMDVLDPTELVNGNPEKTTLLEVDDEFDVHLTWELNGADTTVVGGYWFVSLYSDDMDGSPTSTMTGLLDSSPPIAIVGGVGPLKFEYTFKVIPPNVKLGIYKLTATINHGPTTDPNQLTEMFGFAESTPINIRQTVVESNLSERLSAPSRRGINGPQANEGVPRRLAARLLSPDRRLDR
jgi:hypothetical protein